MLDLLKRYREPLAWVTLALLVLWALRGIIAIVVAVSRGTDLHRAFGMYGYTFQSVVYVVLLGLVLSCVAVAPVTARAAGVARAAFWVGLVTVAFDVISSLLSMGGDRQSLLIRVYGLIGLLLTTAFKAALVFAAWLLTRAAQRVGTSITAVAPTGVGSEVATTQQTAPQTRPTWQASEASGGAWTRAGDAATGASASTWGTPGQPSQGWQQPPTQQPSPPSGQQVVWGQPAPTRPDPGADEPEQRL